MIDTKAFLSRIGLPENTEITRDEAFLRRVQYQHVITVPYENLDILDNRPISLEIPDLYEKIVIRRRGGYCFEVNALLAAFLREAGFTVTSYFARYLRGEPSIPLRRHRVLAVEADDGVFVCDVGIGQTAPRYPLRLEEGLVQPQGRETYKFERDPQLGWVLWEMHRGEWRMYFSFTDDAALEIDFIQPSFYCEKHPASPFNKALMVAIKTPEGRKAINDRDYKEFRGGELVALEENCSDARLTEILREHFGLEWSPAAR